MGPSLSLPLRIRFAWCNSLPCFRSKWQNSACTKLLATCVRSWILSSGWSEFRVYMYDVLLCIVFVASLTHAVAEGQSRCNCFHFFFLSFSPALLAPVGQRLNREHSFTSVPSKLAPCEYGTHTKFGDPPCVACVE